MASFVWIAPGRADLQPNTSCRARLAGEDSEPEGTTQRITLFVRPGFLRRMSSRETRNGESVRLARLQSPPFLPRLRPMAKKNASNQVFEAAREGL